uniref:Molecule interacting with CasL protein 1 n=1 Tax=Ictidomys tridecemlineatus TaxID=43179 RepID=A0A287D6V4_ICTTR
MASPTSTNPAHGHFESFLQAQFCKDVLSSFQGLCEALGLEPGGGLPQYHKIKAQLNYWSAKSLWAKLDKRAGQPVYQQGQACASTKLLLLKVALLLGVEIHWGVTFSGLQPPSGKGSGWRAQLQPSSPAQLANYEFDVLISAAGGKFVPEGFTVREMRGKLAIGITANFVNGRTVEETQVPEISGVARIYNQKFFQSLLKATGIDLENIVYYKDDTHYFVMTAKKQCLLRLGVLRQDLPETDRLLGSANVVPEALQHFARAAADFATHGKLGKLEFAQDAHGRPDISAFDFTSMLRAESSARVQEKHGARLLLGLVGDCLVEPFWPLGTGVARGFLAAFDAAWMVKRWAEGAEPLEVLAERESLYQLLSQTSPENMHRNVAQYGLDPATRYPNLNLRAVMPNQVRDLYDVVTKEPVRKSDKTDFSLPGSVGTQEDLLRWCQEQTAGYPGVHVTDLSSSWTDGLALCALVHRLRPSLLEPEELQGVGALEATTWALHAAEHELGITPVLSAQAVVAGSDPLGLIAYLSHFHSAFKSMSHNPGPIGQISPGTSSAVLFLGKLQRTLQRTRAKVEAEAPSTEELPVPEPSVPLTPPSQPEEASAGDLCALCGKHLYILERFCVDGHFFHRSCFRCHTCEATLWPGDYGQHPEDGHFYCLQHLPQPGHKEDDSEIGPENPVKTVSVGKGGVSAQNSALEGSFMGWGMPGQSQQVLKDIEKEEESPSSSEEEEEEEDFYALLPLTGPTLPQALLTLAKNSDTMNKYPTWRRTLLRRAKEEEMKRFCKAQTIQRRLNEIEAALRELEAEGVELELALRSQSSSPEQQKKLWLEQLLHLVQKKNSLVAEEAELMITVQELDLEEKQWQLDQELRGYMNREETLKTAADRQAEEQVLKKLVDVVNQRDALIRFQEERRLSEL